MIPYWCHLLNPLQSVWMKGRRQVEKGLLSLETIESWIVYVCHSEGEWARHKIYCKCLWTGYGSRCQAHRFASRTEMQLGFSTLNSFMCVSRMVCRPKGHLANLTQLWEALKSTWASIPVEHFWHLVYSMSQRIEAVLLSYFFFNLFF